MATPEEVASIGAEGHDDDNIGSPKTYPSRIPISGCSCVRGAHRHSRFWSGGTNPWSVPWRIVPAATWPSARTWPRRPFGRRGAQRASLKQPDRLRAWLCGIARNLAKNARRKASRPVESAGTQDVLTELSSDEPGPPRRRFREEEESLIWQALERIPDTYREPLILFYREDQSVAEVARALVLSEDAVKQRLSRGRGLLREHVAELVEGSLRRSRPGRRFTVVGYGRPGRARGRSQDRPGGGRGQYRRGSVEGGDWTAAGAGGALGGLVGTLGGLLGGWLGTWVPAQAAATRRERDAILCAGRRMLLVSGVFIAALVRVDLGVRRQAPYVIAWGSWMVAFSAYIAIECVRLAREIKRIRVEQDPTDLPNVTALRAGWTAVAKRFGNRVYRSEATFLGFPLIDINLSAPLPPQGVTPGDASAPDTRDGSLAAGSRSATTPEASWWR